MESKCFQFLNKRKISSAYYLKDSIHEFVKREANVDAVCEICEVVIEAKEEEVKCKNCGLKCHPSCSSKESHCSQSSKNAQSSSRNSVFGLTLEQLLTDDSRIPVAIHKLMAEIEANGLHTEGLYRKRGVMSEVQKLKKVLDKDADQVDLQGYPVHVMTSCLIEFLRDLPEPLLTFERYQEFINAGGMEEQEEEQVKQILSITRKLPEAHFDMLDKLLTHLSKVALYEESNRMGAFQLAIILSPCLLNPPSVLSAEETLLNANKECRCVEVLIAEKLENLKENMKMKACVTQDDLSQEVEEEQQSPTQKSRCVIF